MIFRAVLAWTFLSALLDFLRRRPLAYRYVVGWHPQTGRTAVLDRVAVHSDEEGR